MRILGINALFHDPAAALVIDGRTVAAAEEERFSRRKHGKRPVPFSAWELPEQAAAWCLRRANLRPEDLDAVTYSYDPELARPAGDMGLDDPWDHLRQTYAREAPGFLKAALPGLDPAIVRFVPHHMAHAASSAFAAPDAEDSSVLVLDGRGERASHLAARRVRDTLEPLYAQDLPHSLGLVYEELTAHLGFLRSSDEFKVMALASHGTPRMLAELRRHVYPTGDGGFHATAVPWHELCPSRGADEPWTQAHADVAASAQAVLEETLLDLGAALRQDAPPRPHARRRVALNCVANSRIAREGPFSQVWVQPAAGDAGTALGDALLLAAGHGDDPEPMTGADLGRDWSEAELGAWLKTAAVAFERPPDIADRSRGRWRRTASSRGSRAAPSTARGPSATARCSPTPATRATSNGSTTSRAASSSGPSPPWCSPTARPRSSTGRCRARTCSSCTTWPRSGASASRPSSTSTGRPASRPWTRRANPSSPACSASSRSSPACRSSSTPA